MHPDPALNHRHLYLFTHTELSHMASCSHTSTWVSAVECTPQQLWLSAHPTMLPCSEHSSTSHCEVAEGGDCCQQEKSPSATSLQPQPAPCAPLHCRPSQEAPIELEVFGCGISHFAPRFCCPWVKSRGSKKNHLWAHSSCRPGIGELFLRMS